MLTRLILLIAMIVSPAAFAMSPEEIVAFLFHDIEPGLPGLGYYNGQDSAATERVTSSPALFSAKGTFNGLDATYYFEANRVNACRYSSRMYWNKVEAPLNYIDLSHSKARDLTDVECISVETGDECKQSTAKDVCVCRAKIPTGECSSKDDMLCSDPIPIIFNVSKMSRVKEALAHFRDNICPGRAP